MAAQQATPTSVSNTAVATAQPTGPTTAPVEIASPVQPAEAAPQSAEPAADVTEPDRGATPSESDVVNTPAVKTPTAPEDFASCWHILFEELFVNNHLIYYSLKDEVPRYENDTIYIEVKNNIQKEQLESRKRAIIEYWRNHFSLNVDDLEVTANELKEEKKVIISADDKLRNMVEQNADLPAFLNILGFRMKD